MKLPEIFVRVKNIDQLMAVIQNPKVGTVICGFACLSGLSDKEYTKMTEGRNIKTHVEFPDVLREEKSERVETILDQIISGKICADGVVIENLDMLGLLVKKEYQGKIIGGSFLYAYNSEAVKFYKQYFKGIKFLAPDELTINEIHDIENALRNETAEPQKVNENTDDTVCADNLFIYKVYGHQPVMITNQCMNRNYCGCMKPKLEFRDDKNNDFYITSECGMCYDIIYNGPVTYMLDRLDEIGNRDILLDFTVERKDEVSRVMDILDRAMLGEKIKAGKYTRGHYYKGID